jgi:hypothetical protein
MVGVEAALNSYSASLIDQVMKAVWAAVMWLLRTTFELMDSIGGFRDGPALIDSSGRPSAAAPFYPLWPTLLWIGGAVAIGLFLWQLTLTMLRGGAGFWRVASGPIAYSVATALTLGVVAALVGAAEGLTTLLLQRGLAADNFRTVLDHRNLGLSDNPELDSSMDATARVVLLGMIALVGLLPAAIGFLLQLVFRQAVIVVLIATVPITAAGLLANTTASWFWRCMRWMVAAILMKPVLALVLVIGVNMLSAPAGVGGMLAGAGVLMISLFCPLVLFRLLAFVEVGWAGVGARSVLGAGAGPPLGAQADGHAEQINTARFDAAGVGDCASDGSGTARGEVGSGARSERLGTPEKGDAVRSSRPATEANAGAPPGSRTGGPTRTSPGSAVEATGGEPPRRRDGAPIGVDGAVAGPWPSLSGSVGQRTPHAAEAREPGAGPAAGPATARPGGSADPPAGGRGGTGANGPEPVRAGEVRSP